MWFLNCNCWWPSNSDNTKKHRDNTPNIWPQSLHSPDPPISWAEQVVLIFHAFNVFATLIPPHSGLLFIPHPTRAHFSFIRAGPAFRRFLLGQTERWAQFRSAGLFSPFSSQRLPSTLLLCRFLLNSISFYRPSPPFLLSSFLSFSCPFSPSLFLSLSLWLLIGCLSACGSCVLCVIEQRG